MELQLEGDGVAVHATPVDLEDDTAGVYLAVIVERQRQACVLEREDVAQLHAFLDGWLVRTVPDGQVVSGPDRSGTCTTCGRPANPHPYRHPVTREAGDPRAAGQ